MSVSSHQHQHIANHHARHVSIISSFVGNILLHICVLVADNKMCSIYATLDLGFLLLLSPFILLYKTTQLFHRLQSNQTLFVFVSLS